MVALLLAVAGLPQAAHAAIAARFEVGYEDSYTAGSWTPIRADLTNLPVNGDAKAFRGRAELKVADNEQRLQTYVRPLDLAVNSRKRIEFMAQLPTNFRRFEFELINEKGKTVFQKTFDHAKDAGGAKLIDQRSNFVTYPTVLIVNDEAEVVPFPNVASELVGFRRILPYQLPWDYRGYDNVRLVVVRRPLGKDINESQAEALKFWLSQGGRLMVITPRYGEELNVDPLLSTLLPGTLKTPDEVALKVLGKTDSADSTLLSRWENIRPDAKVLWSAEPGPVVLQVPYGAGSVTAMGIDSSAIGLEGFRSEIGARIYTINEGLMLTPGIEDARARHFWSTSNVEPNFGKRPMPNPVVVLFILASFVIIVGPVNFYLLRKRRMLEAAWFTIPALSIIFFVAVYGYGYVVKGNDQYYASMDLLSLKADQEIGLMLSTGWQFSPRNQYYQFTTKYEGGSLPGMTLYAPANDNMDSMQFGQALLAAPSIPKLNGPSSSFAVQEPQQPDVLRHAVEQWSWEFYSNESLYPIDGKIRGEVRLKDVPGMGLHMALNLENATEATLGNMVLYFGDKSEQLGNLGMGETLSEVIPHSGDFEPANASQAKLELNPGDRFYADTYKQALVGSIGYPYSRYNQQRHVRLLARQNAWQAAVDIEPTPTFFKACSMLEVELPVYLETPVTLDTSNLLTIAMTGGEYTGRFYQRDDDFWEISKDRWNEFVITAPALTGGAVAKGGTLDLSYELSSCYITMEMFDYRIGNWFRMIAPTNEAYQKGNQRLRFVGEIPASCINPIGNFARVRITCLDRETSGEALIGDRVMLKGMSASISFDKVDKDLGVNFLTQ